MSPRKGKPGHPPPQGLITTTKPKHHQHKSSARRNPSTTRTAFDPSVTSLAQRPTAAPPFQHRQRPENPSPESFPSDKKRRLASPTKKRLCLQHAEHPTHHGGREHPRRRRARNQAEHPAALPGQETSRPQDPEPAHARGAGQAGRERIAADGRQEAATGRIIVGGGVREEAAAAAEDAVRELGPERPQQRRGVGGCASRGEERGGEVGRR